MYLIKVYDQQLTDKNKLHTAVKEALQNEYDCHCTQDVEGAKGMIKQTVGLHNEEHARCKPIKVEEYRAGYMLDEHPQMYIRGTGVTIKFYKILEEL